MRDFARASEYPRKVHSFDLVADQSEYELPDDFVSPVALYKDNMVLGNADLGQVANIRNGRLQYWGDGLWWMTPDQGSVGFYPTPAEAGTVTMEYVYQPTALVVDTDEPTAFPEAFHPALIFYVGKVYYSTVEDNPELAQVNEEKYQQQVGELARYRIIRESGGGPFTIGISGVNA